MSNAVIAFASAWAGIGLGLWLAALQHNGWPKRWRSEWREEGWCRALVIYLPLCFIGGPIWWVAMYFARRAR
jgi:hypothetical protein